MSSLVASVVWDEARFGLPLDLERFMIVAVGDFNMGAMENKGLNIFNTKYVLANAATATDNDFAAIESVVGHEYFHNWTGNRITCRDWFQLSLKEGLTVFRDQEFSMDMVASATARAVKRISDVRNLRQVQFVEDAGPMAHPVRPDSYVEINNFYTPTVYEKGAEVVRMMQTLVGRDGFARGINALLRALRRPGRHLRRLRPGDRRRQPRKRAGAPAAAVQALVRAGRNAEGDGARPLRRAVAHLHARPRAGADGGVDDGARAVRDPARDRPGRPRRQRHADAPRGRARERGGDVARARARRSGGSSSPSSTSTSRRCSRSCAASRRR